ncbi:SUR7/PalI family-domain-containing protein [Chlamydoabsidia padenii]|nr:SUR7/PalI family-domain-containing protein [Chlamydoabsidia padenii]
MLYGLASTLGCLFTFASFILNLFIVIGQLSNKPFINRLYFAQATQQNSGQYYNLGLWNYCTSTDQGVQSCSHPKAGYNWIETPGINQALPSLHLSHGLFLGVFILFIIGLCFSFLLWIAGMPLCCVRARSVGASMSTFVMITFLVMLTALIMELVLILRGNYLLHNADPTWTGHAGNSLWLTIGSVFSLLFAFFFYGGSCCCVGAKTDGPARKGRGGGGGKVTPYNDKQHDLEDGAAVGGAAAGSRSPYNFNQSVYHTVQQQSPRVSQQQPYQADGGHYSPVVASQGFEHQPRNDMVSPQPAGSAMAGSARQGYQTPTLQHSDVNSTTYN